MLTRRPYFNNDALAGAVVCIDSLLEFNYVKEEDIERIKKNRRHLWDQIDSPRIRYEIKSGKYKL